MKKIFTKNNSGFTRTPKFGVAPKGGGFTLIETLVALSIFTMSILGLMSVLSSGISDTNYVKQKMAAGYIAQEGIECMRNVRDSYTLYSVTTGLTWQDFVDLPASSIDCPDIDPKFSRSLEKINVPDTDPNPDEVKIYSIVSWNQGSGFYRVTLAENLFNWTQ